MIAPRFVIDALGDPLAPGRVFTASAGWAAPHSNFHPVWLPAVETAEGVPRGS